ncbi:MAG TPA: SMI1/KNR4 family protein [Chitinophagaceae bacterium]|nr:SMI1/KNR4 family protein [Chitinophagaceae bacterium]
MITPHQIENAELDAWQNMFDIAPEDFRKKMAMFYKHVGGGICQVFPNYPVVHFNMVMGLGFTEPVTKEILQQVESIYNEAQQPVYMIQFSDAVQKAEPANIFEEMNYRVGGGWERITWKPQPVLPLQITRNIRVEEVTAATAPAWEKFILDLYHYPAKDWLLAFIAQGWHNFIAIENDKIVACRSIYINKNNFAWSGVEAPVPIVMTSDLVPDRILWKHIQQFCMQQNIALLAADIEVPSPERNTPIYQSFAELGFRVEYLRKLYRKK